MGLTAMLTALAVVAGLAGALAVWVGQRRIATVDADGPARSSGGLRLALLGAGTVSVAWVIAMAVLPVDLFGVIHALYLAATISVPVVGLALTMAVLARRTARSTAVLALVALLPAPLGFYATHVAPFRLTVDRAALAIPADRGGHDQIRIGVLADIQTARVGAHERAAVDRLLALEPDVILITGDFYQGPESRRVAEEAELADLLARLHAPGGVFAVRGDVDFESGPLGELAGTGIQLLDDEVVRVRAGDRNLLIGGTKLDWRSGAAREVYDELAAADREAVVILMAHRPDVVLDLPADARVDLAVAGHTHGGQVTLPFVGPLMTMSEVPRAVAAGGLHEIEGNAVYVSSGVGMERNQAPQLRFRAPPSIGLIEVGDGPEPPRKGGR